MRVDHEGARSLRSRHCAVVVMFLSAAAGCGGNGDDDTTPGPGRDRRAKYSGQGVSATWPTHRGSAKARRAIGPSR